jgi:hypothetical protein
MTEPQMISLSEVFACLRNVSSADYHCGTSAWHERWSVKDVILDWITIRNFVRHEDAVEMADSIIRQIEKMEAL